MPTKKKLLYRVLNPRKIPDGIPILHYISAKSGDEVLKYEGDDLNPAEVTQAGLQFYIEEHLIEELDG